MTRHNGMAARIVACVAAHPGCTRATLSAVCGLRSNSAMPTYCTRQGTIFAAGKRHSLRYYPTREQAEAMHDRLVAETTSSVAEKRKRANAACQIRRRARRHAAGCTPANTRRDVLIALDPGVVISPDVRITIAPPMRDRWAA